MTAGTGLPGSNSVSTGTLNNAGTYSAQLSCLTAAGNTITGLAETTVSVITLSSISISPSPVNATDGAGATVTATGNYSDGSTQNLTSTAVWSIDDPTVAMLTVMSPSPGTQVVTVTCDTELGHQRRHHDRPRLEQRPIRRRTGFCAGELHGPDAVVHRHNAPSISL